jgi:hypothetical protein
VIEVLLEVGVEFEARTAQAFHTAVQVDAFERQATQVDLAPAVAPCEVVIGLFADSLLLRVLIDRDIVIARRSQPFDDVRPPVQTRGAGTDTSPGLTARRSAALVP